MRIKSLALAGITSLIFSLSAGAVPYTGSVALPATTTIDFESLAPNVAVGTISGVTFTDWFTSPYAQAGGNFGSPGFIGNHSLFSSFPIDARTSSISFGAIAESVSFHFASSFPSVATIEALLGTTVIESFVLSGSAFSPTNFVGFTGISFDSIRISTTADAGGSDAYIDNVGFTLAAAPELNGSAATLPLLFSLGLLAVRTSGRRPAALEG